jgi:serine O-acetyltransferase
MIFYYVSRFLWLRNIKSIARLLMQIARFLTGIEIHPGAKIGNGFFMDHAMGIVIGETAEIGKNVTIYHGVTLGGIMPAFRSEEQRGIKRHPTLEDGVIIGSGAQILGPITVGLNARVGANSVVLKSVPEGMSVLEFLLMKLASKN